MSWQQLLSSIRNAFVWWVVLAPWERGVRVRLGKYTTTMEPGVHLRVPGMDRIFVQPIRRRTTDIGVQTVTTSDGQAVTMAGNVEYEVTDVEKLYNSLHDGSATVVDLAAARIAEYVATHDLEECTPRRVEEYAARELGLSEYGLGESQVNITDFAAVRTYRLISDDRQWRDGGMLDMSERKPSNGANHA